MNWPALQTIRLTKLAVGILKAIVPVEIQPIKSNLILLIFLICLHSFPLGLLPSLNYLFKNC